MKTGATRSTPKPDPKTRKRRNCLRCGTRFWSSGAGNRLCRPCQRLNARQCDDQPYRVLS